MALPEIVPVEVVEKAASNGKDDNVTDQDSVQFRADGQPPNQGYELAGMPLRIFSDAEELPAWWSPARDVFLRKILANNAFMSGIVYGESTRVKNTPWKLADETGGQADITYWQRLLADANFGQGFRSLLHSVALDLLTQDNGAFIELIGPGDVREVSQQFEKGTFTFTAKGKRTGRVQQMAYIDAGQTWRTYDPEYPVIYTNPYNGQFVVLHWTRVITFSQFEQGYELGRKIGLCALSRAYEMARLVQAMHTYQYEKLTGRLPELFFTNTPATKLEDAIAMASIGDFNEGFQVFRNSVIVGPKSGGVGAKEFKIAKLGLRDVSDGFDYEIQLTSAVYIVALAFGIDAREIWPATTSGATKADAEIQHMKTTGKGRADSMQMIEDAINWRVFPPEVTFKFDLVDDMEDKQKAEIGFIRANTRSAQLTSGEISPEEARHMAAQSGDIPPSFLGAQVVADDTTDVSNEGSNAPAPPAAENDAPDAPAVGVPAVTRRRGEVKKKISIKRHGRSRSQFYLVMLNLAENALAGQLPRSVYTRAVRAALKDWYTTAFTEGLREGTGNATVALDSEEAAKLAAFIKTQSKFVPGLSKYIYTHQDELTFVNLFDRIGLWARKGFDTAWQMGLLMGRDNEMLEWFLGATEKHCATCGNAAGQIHRAKEWERSGIVPRADVLECHGFRCDCDLRPSQEKARGNLTRIPVFVGTEKIRLRVR